MAETLSERDAKIAELEAVLNKPKENAEVQQKFFVSARTEYCSKLSATQHGSFGSSSSSFVSPPRFKSLLRTTTSTPHPIFPSSSHQAQTDPALTDEEKSAQTAHFVESFERRYKSEPAALLDEFPDLGSENWGGAYGRLVLEMLVDRVGSIRYMELLDLLNNSLVSSERLTNKTAGVTRDEIWQRAVERSAAARAASGRNFGSTMKAFAVVCVCVEAICSCTTVYSTMRPLSSSTDDFVTITTGLAEVEAGLPSPDGIWSEVLHWQEGVIGKLEAENSDLQDELLLKDQVVRMLDPKKSAEADAKAREVLCQNADLRSHVESLETQCREVVFELLGSPQGYVLLGRERYGRPSSSGQGLVWGRFRHIP